MYQLKLGIIGLSEGNGHPYSWAAIFNGYNAEYMANCPFPVIPKYLSEQQFPEDSIKEAVVTHIWTQDIKVSRAVARASNIQNVVRNYSELIGKVDGILLARDDAENHYEMCKVFLEEGLPVYIDKPLAYTVEEANNIYKLEKYPGQVFTCSAIRYAKEFQISSEVHNELGDIQYVEATIPKDWKKYSVHIIEPVINLLHSDDEIKSIKAISVKDKRFTVALWDSGIVTKFTTLGSIAAPIKIIVVGSKGSTELLFNDTFYAFKSALKEFINVIKTKENPITKENTLKVISIIEAGDKNVE